VRRPGFFDGLLWQEFRCMIFVNFAICKFLRRGRCAIFCGSINFVGDGWVLSCYEKRDCSEFFLRAARELCGSAIKGGLKW
jgi:hypothetical protein